MTFTTHPLCQHNSEVIHHGNNLPEGGTDARKASAEKVAAPTFKMLIHGDNYQMQTEVTYVHFHISYHWSKHQTSQTANTSRGPRKQGSLQNHFCCVSSGSMVKKKLCSIHCTRGLTNTDCMQLVTAIAIDVRGHRDGIRKSTTGPHFSLYFIFISKKYHRQIKKL